MLFYHGKQPSEMKSKVLTLKGIEANAIQIRRSCRGYTTLDERGAPLSEERKGNDVTYSVVQKAMLRALGAIEE